MFSEQTTYKDDRFSNLSVIVGNHVSAISGGPAYEMILVVTDEMCVIGHIETLSDARGFARGFFDTTARALGITEPGNVINKMFMAGAVSADAKA